MMKFAQSAGSAALLLLAASPAFADADSSGDAPQAIEVSAASAEGNEHKLRGLIAAGVKNATVGRFIVYGGETGFSACAEAGPNVSENDGFRKLADKLGNFQAEGIYSAVAVKHCLALPAAAEKPATLTVGKADGSLSCEPGSGSGLADMREELGAVYVYSAEKRWDGQLKPTVCGTPTGAYNAYEIAETDLATAQAAGFNTWEDITAGAQSNVSGGAMIGTASICNIIYSGGVKYEICYPPK